ncbi:MAG: aspartate--tRNA ligase [Christensenellales bacterium]
MKRTKYCGSFREEDIGKTVTACGWLRNRRDMGGVIFIDLGDREGDLQVVFDLSQIGEQSFAQIERLRLQSVVAVAGTMRLRHPDTANPRLETGRIELLANKLEVLSTASPLPFPLEDGSQTGEETRLKHRYLDLRRPAMQQALRFRHAVQRAAQSYLDGEGFTFVETPTLTKSTPEGARDYIVPSRVHIGEFYALPQSPQIFKQLLMVGGVDRYYQLARCYRDEDLRSDRQPEFTQLDVEMSFADQEDVLSLMEGLVKHIFKKTLNADYAKPFRRITWQQAMDIYGSDKPDTRFGLEICDVTDIAEKSSFGVFKGAVAAGGVVRAICIKGGADLSRADIELLTEKAVGHGAKGMAWIMLRESGEVYSILTKYLKPDQIESIRERTGAKDGDFILFCADALDITRRVLGRLRLNIAHMRGLIPENESDLSKKFSFIIVTDFPQFEFSPLEGRWTAMHHPFTMPREEDIPLLQSDPGRVRALAYDIVLNGVELGGGSIRIHQADIQRQMFETLGFSPEAIQERFGFMVNAFQYGTPPHGGFALGFDRLVMLMLGAKSLRDVIAFPKTKEASCLMTEAPGPVEQRQLEELKLFRPRERRSGMAAKKGAGKEGFDVQKIAELSMLLIPPDKEESLAAEMEEIIRFAGQIEEASVDNVQRAISLSNVFRQDAIVNSPPRETMLASAPTKNDRFVTVPKVVG